MLTRCYQTWRACAAAVVSRSLVLAALVGLSGAASAYPSGPLAAADDPIRPNGVKRTRADIVAFMEAEVMPFARRALEPIVGVGKVRCDTCHGANADAHGWRMPAVAALPEPSVKSVAAAAGADSQIRNALHGYLTQDGTQPKAARMVGVVLPGMAALLRRPAYDFTQSYEYNTARGAFGCYHCHRVGD